MLGAELRKAREEAGMTQEELSFAAQIDRSYISLMENDKKSPTIDMLFRICSAIDVLPSTLIKRIELSQRAGRRKR